MVEVIDELKENIMVCYNKLASDTNDIIKTIYLNLEIKVQTQSA